MARKYVVLEDRESLDWVQSDPRFRLDPWRPEPASAGSPRYGNVVDLLKALARGRSLPDVVFLDDAVPRGAGDDRVMDAYAAAVASAVRHLAGLKRAPQPRIVVITATALDGQDLLAMLELGADDVVAKGDLGPAGREAYRVALNEAIDDRRPRAHATNAMDIKARCWPPRRRWRSDVNERIRAGLIALLPLLPLWQAGIVHEELVNRHLKITERSLLPDMRGINRHFLTRAEQKAQRFGWLRAKFDPKAPLRGLVAEGAPEDGLLWVRERSRNRARDLPWQEILAGCDPNLTPPAGHAPFASGAHPHLRELLYQLPHDPRRERGGACIYEQRLT